MPVIISFLYVFFPHFFTLTHIQTSFLTTAIVTSRYEAGILGPSAEQQQ